MGDFKINEKTVFTQSGGGEPAMGSTITGIPAAGVTGVLPAGVTGGSGLDWGVRLLYSNTASAATTISIDGYFDDSIYAYYEAHFLDLQASLAAQGYIRLNTGGTQNSGDLYWSIVGEILSTSGTVSAVDRADNDGGSFITYDGTWNMPRISIDGTSNLVLRLGSPQSTSIYKHVYTQNLGGGQNESEAYIYADYGGFVFKSLTAVTGITLLLSAAGTINGKILLYGYKK